MHTISVRLSSSHRYIVHLFAMPNHFLFALALHSLLLVIRTRLTKNKFESSARTLLKARNFVDQTIHRDFFLIKVLLLHFQCSNPTALSSTAWWTARRAGLWPAWTPRGAGTTPSTTSSSANTPPRRPSPRPPRRTVSTRSGNRKKTKNRQKEKRLLLPIA